MRRAHDGDRPPMVADGGSLAIAYVTTRFPALSHTFIRREIDALRERGIAVYAVSMHRAAGEHLLSEDNRKAAESTYAIRPPRWREVLGAHVAAAISGPVAYMATLRLALGMARPGWRGRLWQLFYFAEAIVLWRHCTAVGARHIHAHHGSPPADAALLAARFGALAKRGPSTWSMTVHGPTELSNTRWYRLPEKVRRADGVVCISDFARSQLMALVDEAHWSKLEVIHCGLEAQRYVGVSVPRPRRPQLLCVGRLVPEKGQAILIKALALLRERGHDVDLVLVGSGPGGPGLQRLASEIGVADHVDFAGSVGEDEIARHFASATVFCSSSFGEGVPVVLMEALACGCPVVATAIAGVRELVRDGETGLLVSPGRVDELARAIATLLGDERLARRLAENGRSHVAREFDVRRSAVQLDGFFRRLADAADLDLVSAEHSRELSDEGVAELVAGVR